jgi:hypothetical protein
MKGLLYRRRIVPTQRDVELFVPSFVPGTRSKARDIVPVFVSARDAPSFSFLRLMPKGTERRTAQRRR